MILNTFINLATKNVALTKTFFMKLGFEINEKFTDDEGMCVVVNDHTFMMIMTYNRFENFTALKTPNSFKENEVILTFELQNKEEVDQFMGRVLENGGTEFGQAEDTDFMYYRSFRDLDGHHFEVFYFKKPV